MDAFVRGFIKSSLFWLGTGVLLGLGMAMAPFSMMAYRPAHVHANLLGFVSMMIFGVAYHVIPRFSGNGLYSTRLPVMHLYAANAGLLLMVTGFIVRVSFPRAGEIALGTGGLCSAVGAFTFIFNIWKTLSVSDAARVAIGSARR